MKVTYGKQNELFYLSNDFCRVMIGDISDVEKLVVDLIKMMDIVKKRKEEYQ